MSTTRKYDTLPDSANGASVASGTSAWGFGSYVALSTPGFALGGYISGVTIQPDVVTASLAVDVTGEGILELYKGDSDTLFAQVPFVWRIDTRVSHCFPIRVMFPEPLEVEGNVRIRARVADSIAAAMTHNGIKLLAYENEKVAVTLSSPADAASTSDTTPDLVFNGTDADSDDIRYEVQIDTATSFLSQETSLDVTTFSYASKAYTVTAQEGTPLGVAFKTDGTKMYVIGEGNDTVYQYALGVAWDVSTAVYESKTMSVSSQDGFPRNLSFSSDGTKCFVIGSGTDAVYQYTLTVAWDISSGSYASKSFSVSGQEATPAGLAFSADGTQAYVLGSTNNTVYQYTLSTAWDASTASYASKSMSVASQETTSTGLDISPNGKHIIIVGTANDTVYQYDLSTAWDVSTGSYASKSLSVTSQETFPFGLRMNYDGSSFYILGYISDNVSQFNGTAFLAPLQKKISGTDAGFSGSPDNTDPFTAGQDVTFTVQSALSSGTYYWRVRGTDPTGVNTWGEWSATRSFTVSSGGSYTKNLTETITVGDTVSRLTARTLSEVTSLADSVVRIVARALAEALVLSDTVVRFSGKVVVEAATLSDNITRSAGKVILNTTTLTDSVVRYATRVFTEALSFVDTVLRQVFRTLSETISSSDVFQTAVIKVKELSDAVALVDTVNRFFSRVLSEVGSITDTLVKQSTRVLSDVVSSADSVLNVKAILRTFSEVANITDATIGNERSTDSYSEGNASSGNSLYSGNYTKVGQTFANDVVSRLVKARFYVKRTGSPTGNMYAKLYNITGTFGSTAVPTGSPLATSDPIDVSLLSTSNTLVDLFFTGVEMYILAAGTNYGISLEYDGGDSSNRVDWSHDSTSPTHAGNMYRSISSYIAEASLDLCFYVRVTDYTNGLTKRTTKVLSEAVTNVDTTFRNVARNLVESITHSDVYSYTNGLAKELLEAVNVTDSLVRQTGKVLTDAVVFTDTVVKSVFKTISNAVTSSDVFSSIRVLVRDLSETVALSDMLQRLTSKVFSEAVAISDVLRRLISRTVSEVSGIGDILVKQGNRLLSEGIALSDSILRSVTRTFSETLGITGSAIKATQRALSQAVVLADNVLRSAGRSLSDTVTLFDNILLLKTLARTLSEAVTLVDIVFTQLTQVVRPVFDKAVHVLLSVGGNVVARVQSLVHTLTTRGGGAGVLQSKKDTTVIQSKNDNTTL